MHRAENADIVITGCGPHLGQLAQMADHVSSRHRVWTGDAGTPEQWATAVGGEAVSSPDALDPESIVIGGETAGDGGFAFPYGGGVWVLPGTSHRVRHPVVLSDLAFPDHSGRIVACGYPGTGNGVVQALLDQIVAAQPLEPASGIPALFPAYAADYLKCAIRELRVLGARIEGGEPSFASYREEDAVAQWVHEMDGSVLFGVPIRNHLFERVHKTHESCGEKIERMCEAGAKCVLSVRNPLDTLVSIANKAWNCVSLLDSEWLLRATARGLVAYWRSFESEAMAGRILPVRYEDLVADFEAAAERLSAGIGVALPDGEAARLRQLLWNRPVADRGHLWKAGMGKWKQYMTRRHIEILLEEGVGSAMERLGYEAPAASDVPESAALRMREPGHPIHIALSFFVFCLGDAETTLAEFGRNVRGRFHANADGLTFISTSANALREFDAFAGQSALLKIVAAGRRVHPHSPAS
jgi:hypothetical protein